MRFTIPVTSTIVIAMITPELASSLSILMAALFVGVVNVIAAWSAAKQAARKAIAPVEEKIDALVPVVAKIDMHVNGEKTRAEGVEHTQKMQIELQREMIEELKKAAALLAQAKATADLTAVVANATVADTTTPTSQKEP